MIKTQREMWHAMKYTRFEGTYFASDQRENGLKLVEGAKLRKQRHKISKLLKKISQNSQILWIFKNSLNGSKRQI